MAGLKQGYREKFAIRMFLQLPDGRVVVPTKSWPHRVHRGRLVPDEPTGTILYREFLRYHRFWWLKMFLAIVAMGQLNDWLRATFQLNHWVATGIVIGLVLVLMRFEERWNRRRTYQPILDKLEEVEIPRKLAPGKPPRWLPVEARPVPVPEPRRTPREVLEDLKAFRGWQAYVLLLVLLMAGAVVSLVTAVRGIATDASVVLVALFVAFAWMLAYVLSVKVGDHSSHQKRSFR